MDPFSILPSLVQTEIFVHLQSDISVKQVIQASPSMLWHFIAYKKSILRCIMYGILNGDTSGDLLRDALGIIYISDKASAKRYRQTEMWKTMELPDTLDLEQLEALWHIISRMIIFIEDYVSKATSECPPRAYLGIMDLLNGSGSYFKGQRLDTNAVRFSSLTSAERYRFLPAFTRHELICRIYYPLPRTSTEADAVKRQVVEISEGTELMTLLSVHQYYRNVCGALFAHCHDCWLPHRSGQPDQPLLPSETRQSTLDSATLPNTTAPSSSRHGLIFPDNICFEAKAYERGLDEHANNFQRRLPCLGLD